LGYTLKRKLTNQENPLTPVYMVRLNRELNQEWIFRISFPKYSWRISLSLQLPLESSKHLCPHALTANITS
ncbi:MAG: hypothetical protein ACLVBO_15535, partial [Phocaeicola vulgatus]